jgi:DNA-directed RNA polymerase specialized sigma24 family protein
MNEKYDATLDVIPRLRRYTRLLTGSREVADDYAHVCLERLVQAQVSVVHPDVAVEVFHCLHRVVSDAEIKLDTALGERMSRLERELLALPVVQRKAVLLTHVENFPRREAAFITGMTVKEFSQALAAGRAVLRRNIAASVFIIEDELLVALDISQLVEEFGHNVCGTAARTGEALIEIEARRPSLILADVQLGDAVSAGIDACETMRNRYDVQVIYVTGHPDRVRQALKRDDVMVVPKPIERETLRRAMGQALGFVA